MGRSASANGSDTEVAPVLDPRPERETRGLSSSEGLFYLGRFDATDSNQLTQSGNSPRPAFARAQVTPPKPMNPPKTANPGNFPHSSNIACPQPS